jgi:hypothetical protein
MAATISGKRLRRPRCSSTGPFSATSGSAPDAQFGITKTADVNLMSSPERFQNVVSGAGEGGYVHETLSIITEDACRDVLIRSEVGPYFHRRL